MEVWSRGAVVWCMAQLSAFRRVCARLPGLPGLFEYDAIGRVPRASLFSGR